MKKIYAPPILIPYYFHKKIRGLEDSNKELKTIQFVWIRTPRSTDKTGGKEE